jgi:Mn2+/Fe2+ NRAMP family transporter
MQQELALKAITHSTIGIAILTLLLLLLVGLRREIQGGEPIRGMFHLGIVVMALCTFVALMVATLSAKKMAIRENISQRFETVTWKPHLKKL